MKWKDILLGAIITLIITIIGGVIVYYLTREAKQEKMESLVYYLNTPAGFETQTNKLAISNIRTENVGNLPAKNVRINIEFPENIKIVDKAISVSSGDTSNFNLESPIERKLIISIPNLLPYETVSITLLLNAKPPKPPAISVRSDSSIGIDEMLIRNVEVKPQFWITTVLPFLLPLLLLLQIPLFYLLRQSITYHRPSLNNTAFLYMHKGLIKDAETLFLKAIMNGTGGGHELANYASCVAISGDLELAEKYIDVAFFYAKSNHMKAVAHFNRAIIRFRAGKEEEGLSDIKSSIKLSRRQILLYCEYSSIITNLCNKYVALRDYIVSEKARS